MSSKISKALPALVVYFAFFCLLYSISLDFLPFMKENEGYEGFNAGKCWKKRNVGDIAACMMAPMKPPTKNKKK